MTLVGGRVAGGIDLVPFQQDRVHLSKPRGSVTKYFGKQS